MWCNVVNTEHSGCCVTGALADQDGSNLACSVPASFGSSVRADVPNMKKKHRRIKSTSRGSDPCVDAGKCQPKFIYSRGRQTFWGRGPDEPPRNLLRVGQVNFT